MPPKFIRNLSSDDVRVADDVEKEHLLDHNSDADEEMLFNQPSVSNKESRSTGAMDSVKIQIQEVTGIMRENVQKVMERGERLEDLQEASDRLSMAGDEFYNAAKRAQRKAWMQNLKARIIVGGIVLTIVLCIIVPIIVKYS